MPQPLAPEGKSSKKGLIIAIVAGFIFLMAAGAGAFYYYSNIYLAPEKVFEDAIKNLTKLDSGKLDYEISISMKPSLSNQANQPSAATSLSLLMPQEFNLSAAATINFAKNNDFVQTASEINIDIPAGTQIPLVGQMTYSPKISIVSVDKENLYAKIEGIPVLPFFDASKINNQWIKINFQELQAQYGLKIKPSAENDSAKVKDFLQKFTDVYKKNSFFKWQKLKSETIDNAASYHYAITLDKEAFKKFITALDELSKQEGLDKDYNLNLEDQLKSLDEVLAKLDFSGEIWIAKKGRIIKKAVANLLMNDPNYSSEVKSTIVLTNYNQPIKIDEPTNAMSFKELMDSMMGTALETSREKASDAKTIADVKQTQTALELYFNDFMNYPLPPVGGNRLGVDTTCLSEGGFSQLGTTCTGNTYMALLPAHPNSPVADYLYYSCADNDYVIEFSISQDVGNLKAGKNYATPSGIYPQNDGAEFVLREVCLDPDKDGLANYSEEKYGTDKNNPDTDGDSYLDGAEVLKGYNPKGSGKL
ncbi:MAG: hypothetical protein WC675_03940 [Patescibacteria group bacterium]